MKEWTSDRVVKMVDVTGGFFGDTRIGKLSWVISQMAMSLISLLVLTLKISSITFVMVEGF